MLKWNSTTPLHIGNSNWQHIKDTEIDSWCNSETKWSCHLCQVQCLNIKYLLEVMRIVRPDVRLVRLLSWQIEEVVLTDQLFQLQHREFQCDTSLTAEALTSSQQSLKIVPVSQKTHCVSISKTNKLMSFMVTTAFIISHTNKEAKANTLMQKRLYLDFNLCMAHGSRCYTSDSIQSSLTFKHMTHRGTKASIVVQKESVLGAWHHQEVSAWVMSVSVPIRLPASCL